MTEKFNPRSDVKLTRTDITLRLDIVGTDGKVKRIEADPKTIEGMNSVYRKLVNLETDSQISEESSSYGMRLIKEIYDYGFDDYIKSNLPKLAKDLFGEEDQSGR